jgi:hypothetical protein
LLNNSLPVNSERFAEDDPRSLQLLLQLERVFL